MAKILGVDLGTTNSCMSVMEGGEPIVLENSEGARTTPSVVAFAKSGERLVGQAAKRQAITNPQNTIFSVKRFMGRKFEEVRNELHRVPYTVVKAANGDAHIQVTVGGETKTYSPPEISAMILAKLKADAEAKLGEKITQAVITVPAYFNDSQRNATKDAGKIAGLEVLRIINEPTAASLAYGLDKKKDEEIAVYDLGGGTFDISVLEIGDGVFEVKATNGDTHLGGDDWDNRLMDWIFEEFKKDSGIDLTKQPDAVQRVKEEAEKAKIALSSSQQYEINLPFITADQTGPKHIQKSLSRAKLEQLTDDLFERTMKPVRACLADAKLSEKDVDELVLVGGMTRMPRVVETARQIIGKPVNLALGNAAPVGRDRHLGEPVWTICSTDAFPIYRAIRAPDACRVAHRRIELDHLVRVPMPQAGVDRAHRLARAWRVAHKHAVDRMRTVARHPARWVRPATARHVAHEPISRIKRGSKFACR